jgi:hypothetical protein
MVLPQRADVALVERAGGELGEGDELAPECPLDVTDADHVWQRAGTGEVPRFIPTPCAGLI